MAWHQVLDRVHTPAAIAELTAEPTRVRDALATALPADPTFARLADSDAMIVDAFARVEALIVRAAKVSLEYALADDGTLAAATRNVFASTLVRYADNLPLLAQRAHDAAVRSGSRGAADVADRVVDVARAMLALRVALLEGVLGLAAERAALAAPIADGHARDRRLPEPERMRWSALRRDLEATAANPMHVLTGAMAERLAQLPAQLDEPDPANEPTFADMIELD